jgi:PBP1b-binding outer membrane lipoprotein LpoB
MKRFISLAALTLSTALFVGCESAVMVNNEPSPTPDNTNAQQLDRADTASARIEGSSSAAPSTQPALNVETSDVKVQKQNQ